MTCQREIGFPEFKISISKHLKKENGNQIHEKIQNETKKDSTFLFEMNEIPKVRDFFSSWF